MAVLKSADARPDPKDICWFCLNSTQNLKLLINYKDFNMREFIKDYFLPTAALVMAFWSLCMDYQQNKQIEENTQTTLATENRPKLVIAGKPKLELTSLEFPGKPIDEILTKLFLHKQKDTISIEVEIKVKWTAQITNIGSSLGKIDATASRDTLSDLPEIRTPFLKRTVDLNKWNIEEFPPYYKNKLNPGDTTIISTEYYIRYLDIKSQSFTIHMLVLYENDIGSLFDTYVCSVHKFSIANFAFAIFPSEDRQKIIRKFGVLPDIDKMATPEKFMHRFHIYKPEDADYIRKIMIRAGERGSS